MSLLKPYPIQLNLDDYPDSFSLSHRRILSARHISPNEIDKSLNKLINVEHLKSAKLAANHLYQAIKNKKKIVIIGDYDADGATATAVIASVLNHLQASFDTVIPNRHQMGYGLSAAAAQVALAKQAELIITVDNGITAVDSIAQLRAAGVEVIITDHHLPTGSLPKANFIINPNQPGCPFPSKHLAGVGVAFYFMLALRQIYREHNQPDFEQFSLADLLPYVAIGTIADVVVLDYNNRILVEQGLRRIRAQKMPIGIKALIDIAHLDYKTLNTTEIAFHLAPRLNAAGRIADMQLGIDCLLARSERLATDYAMELDKLNRERKAIENEMRIQADAIIQSYDDLTNQAVICLYQAQWNEGVIGILASRLKEKYEKTAFVFTRTEEQLKASARAGNGVNLIEALNKVNGLDSQLLNNYGGHAKAAGLTLHPKDLSQFEHLINTVVAEQLATQSIDSVIYTDGELHPDELTLNHAHFIKTLETWGTAIPEPLFENSFLVNDIKEVGKNHAQMQLIEIKSGHPFKGIAFHQFELYSNLRKQHCRVAYQLSINEWQGRRSLNLVISHAEKINSI